MGMYAAFQTDRSLEQEGIWIDYHELGFRVLLARAGGSNERFNRCLRRLTKPHRRAIQAGGQMPSDAVIELQKRIYKEAFAETAVLGWQVKVPSDDPDAEPSYTSGIEGPDGSTLPFSKENVLKTFEALPDLFADLSDQASSFGQFQREEEQGN